MPGVLADVLTQTRAINLDVSRQLNMGDECTLRFIKPQDDGSGGTVLVAEYSEAFDRLPAVEREVGDGSTVVVDIADIFEPPGLLREHINEGKYIQFTIDGVESPLYEMNDVPSPAFNEAQVYRITCGTVTLKQTYFRMGR